MTRGTDSFGAKKGSEFSFQGFGDIVVVCAMAKQNGKGFLFPAFSFNSDDGASHGGFPFKEARSFDGTTLSCFNSSLIRDDIFTNPRCVKHDQGNLVVTESGGAQFVDGLLGLCLEFKDAYYG